VLLRLQQKRLLIQKSSSLEENGIEAIIKQGKIPQMEKEEQLHKAMGC